MPWEETLCCEYFSPLVATVRALKTMLRFVPVYSKEKWPVPQPECWPGELPLAWSSCVENLKKCVVDADRQEGGTGIAVTILESHVECADFPNPRSNTPSYHNAASDLRA